MLSITIVLQVIISLANTDSQHHNEPNKQFQVLYYPLPEEWNTHTINCNIAVDTYSQKLGYHTAGRPKGCSCYCT